MKKELTKVISGEELNRVYGMGLENEKTYRIYYTKNWLTGPTLNRVEETDTYWRNIIGGYSLN